MNFANRGSVLKCVNSDKRKGSVNAFEVLFIASGLQVIPFNARLPDCKVMVENDFEEFW